MARLLRWVAGIYLCYLLLSLLVILPALNIGAPMVSERLLERELRSDLILFNPFNLALTARNVSLSEYQQPDSVFAGFEELEVNLSTASLWQQGWVLDTALLEGFHAHLRRTGPDTFNISDLMAGEDDASDDAEPAEIPGVTIGESTPPKESVIDRLRWSSRMPVWTSSRSSSSRRCTSRSSAIRLK